MQKREHVRIIPLRDPLGRIAAAHAVCTGRFADDQRLTGVEPVMRIKLVVEKDAALGNTVKLGDRADALAAFNRVDFHKNCTSYVSSIIQYMQPDKIISDCIFCVGTFHNRREVFGFSYFGSEG